VTWFLERKVVSRREVVAEGQVRITQADGSKVIASADDGFLSMENDELTIVAGHASLQS
jgi:F-type H+-transporting ATPase subunit epsilon